MSISIKNSFNVRSIKARAYGAVHRISEAQQRAVLSVLVAGMAMTGTGNASAGFGSLFGSLTTLLGSAKTLVIAVCGFVGFCCVCWGVYDIFKKADDDRGDVKVGSIILKIVGGVFLAGVTTFMSMASSDVGMPA